MVNVEIRIYRGTNDDPIVKTYDLTEEGLLSLQRAEGDELNRLASQIVGIPACEIKKIELNRTEEAE